MPFTIPQQCYPLSEADKEKIRRIREEKEANVVVRDIAELPRDYAGFYLGETIPTHT